MNSRSGNHYVRHGINTGLRGQYGLNGTSVNQGGRSVGGRQQSMSGSGNISVPKCHRCGKMGHKISECRWTSGACFGCGQQDHMVRDCNSGGGECLKCGQRGHWARECPQRARSNVPVCGNCGQGGHFARMCQRDRSMCEKCGVTGHLTRLCKSRNRVNGAQETAGTSVQAGIEETGN